MKIKKRRRNNNAPRDESNGRQSYRHSAAGCSEALRGAINRPALPPLNIWVGYGSHTNNKAKPVIQQGDGSLAAADWRHRDRTAMTNTCGQCWKYNPPDAYMICVGGLKQKYTQTETLSLRLRRKLLHTDVYSSLDLSFKLIKLGWTMVTAPSHSRQTTWLKKWLGHAEQFCGELTVTFIAFTLRSDLIRGAPVHTAVCKWRKADLLHAHVGVRRLLTCTGRPGDGVDVIMYADDVSSSINDKVKHNYQAAI